MRTARSTPACACHHEVAQVAFVLSLCAGRKAKSVRPRPRVGHGAGRVRSAATIHSAPLDDPRECKTFDTMEFTRAFKGHASFQGVAKQ